MARNLAIQHIRTTRANLNTQASATNLKAGELYLITDENRIAIGLTTSTYETYAKESEADKLTFNPQTGTTYTIVTADQGLMLRMNNASAITLTIDTNANQPMVTGAVISIEQMGAGVVTVTPASGVTINSTARKTWGQYSVIQVYKVDTNVWNVIGGVA